MDLYLDNYFIFTRECIRNWKTESDVGIGTDENAEATSARDWAAGLRHNIRYRIAAS